MSGRVFFDTNVLVYLHDHDAPAKQKRARELVGKHGLAGEIVVSTQVLMEFYVTVTRKLARPLPAADAEEQVRRFGTWAVASTDAGTCIDALSLHRKHGISPWDALILTSAAREGCAEVLSEDLGDGRAYGPVTVRNPFAGI